MAPLCLLLTPSLSLFAPASRPAACMAASRCAPLRASHGNAGEHWIEFDDSGDECLISEAGSTCMNADVAGPIRIDGLDEERRYRSPPQTEEARSPGLANDFSSLSTADFIFGEGTTAKIEADFAANDASAAEPDPQPEPAQAPAASASHGNANEHYVDFGDSGDECLISDAGSTCMDADVAGPLRMDGIDESPRQRAPQTEEERRRRSPGLVNDFSKLSTADFKRSHDAVANDASAAEPAPKQEPEPQPADVPAAGAAAPARKAVGRARPAFPVFSSSLLR